MGPFAGAQDAWDAALAVEELLVSNAAVLSQHVAVGINTERRCRSCLPLLLDRHLPDPCRLPFLVARMAELKDWSMTAEFARSVTEVSSVSFIQSSAVGAKR